MADNGLGRNINIPSVFIFHIYGEKMKNLYNNQIIPLDDDLDGKKMVVKISFPTQYRDPVDYSFYINTPDDSAYSFIRKFDILRGFVENNSKIKTNLLL